MFSQACVKNSVQGGMHGEEVCVVKGGACLAKGRYAWGVGVGGGWACVAGETATAADSTHLTGMHSCT